MSCCELGSNPALSSSRLESILSNAEYQINQEEGKEREWVINYCNHVLFYLGQNNHNDDNRFIKQVDFIDKIPALSFVTYSIYVGQFIGFLLGINL